jgi:hypothetical protein
MKRQFDLNNLSKNKPTEESIQDLYINKDIEKVEDSNNFFKFSKSSIYFFK